MVRTLIASLLTLCFSAVPHQGGAARQDAAAAGEALAALTSRLEAARAVDVPRVGITMSLNSARAEGCVLRYNITSESTWPNPNHTNGPQVAEQRLSRTDYEWAVNLAELGPARAAVRNPPGIKNGGSVTARAQEGHGTVYLFRGRDTADYPPEVNVLNPEAVIYLDAKEFLSLPERTFVGFKIPAGRYVLSMKGNRAGRPLWVEAGKTYYLRAEQTVYPHAYRIIYDVEEKTALNAIQRCYTLGEKKVKLKQFEAIRVKPGAGGK